MDLVLCTTEQIINDTHQPFNGELPLIQHYEVLQEIRRHALQAVTMDRLTLSNRARNVLTRNNLSTLWDCMELDAVRAASLAGGGSKTRNEVYDAVRKETGLRLSKWLEGLR